MASGLELPAPSGPCAIGTRTFHWVDGSRREVAGPPGRNREVVVQLWYPTKSGRPAPYVPDFEILTKYTRELDRLGLTILGAGLRQMRSLASHAVLDAPIAPEPVRHPVLLFSPGNSVPRFAYTIQLEELASYGYVVAAIDHPYSTGIVVLPGGRVVLQASGAGAPAFEERVATRAADMRFVLDRLSAEFAEHLDLTRVGVFGHSLGGIASLQVAGQDERFQAALNEDGGDGTLDESLRRGSAQPLGLRAPLMLIVKMAPVAAPTAKQLASWGMNETQYKVFMADVAARNASTRRQVRTAAYCVSIAGAAHMNFSDVAFLEGDRRGIAPLRALAIANAYTRAFFDHYLRGTSSPLLDVSEFPEAKLEKISPPVH